MNSLRRALLLKGIDMGFPRAKVTAEDMGCRKGEKVARARWAARRPGPRAARRRPRRRPGG